MSIDRCAGSVHDDMLTASSATRPARAERVQPRRGRRAVAVGADVVAPQGVDRDEHDALRPAVGVEVVDHRLRDASDHVRAGRDRLRAGRSASVSEKRQGRRRAEPVQRDADSRASRAARGGSACARRARGPRRAPRRRTSPAARCRRGRTSADRRRSAAAGRAGRSGTRPVSSSAGRESPSRVTGPTRGPPAPGRCRSERGPWNAGDRRQAPANPRHTTMSAARGRGTRHCNGPPPAPVETPVQALPLTPPPPGPENGGPLSTRGGRPMRRVLAAAAAVLAAVRRRCPGPVPGPLAAPGRARSRHAGGPADRGGGLRRDGSRSRRWRAT